MMHDVYDVLVAACINHASSRLDRYIKMHQTSSSFATSLGNSQRKQHEQEGLKNEHIDQKKDFRRI